MRATRRACVRFLIASVAVAACAESGTAYPRRGRAIVSAPMSVTADDAAPTLPCGTKDGPCCPGNVCGRGLVCEAAGCVVGVTCGEPITPCCAGGVCRMGLLCGADNVCQNPVAVACGTAGAPCCADRSAPCSIGLACQGGTCQSCGRSGEICCTQGSGCLAELTCSDGHCEAAMPPPTPAPMPTPATMPSPAMFDCGDGQRVATSARCNGRIDCLTLADELGCSAPTDGGTWVVGGSGGSSSSSDGWFSCGNGFMVPLDFLCDGFDDCGNIADELVCGW